MRKVALPLFIFLASASGLLAKETLSIHSCVETETCNAHGRCTNNETRLLIGEVFQVGNGSRRYLVMGPMQSDASGGVFFSQDVDVVSGAVKAPSSEIGRAINLGFDDEDGMMAMVYRPGKEVRGFFRSEWVRADYACKQELF